MNENEIKNRDIYLNKVLINQNGEIVEVFAYFCEKCNVNFLVDKNEINENGNYNCRFFKEKTIKFK